jgi:hypothetical protein
MRKHSGLVLTLGFAVLVGLSAREAQAGYFLYVTITDNTTPANSVTYAPFGEGNPSNTYNNVPGSGNEGIAVGGGALSDTTATGLSLTGLQTTTTYGASSTVLTVLGNAAVLPGNTDSYTVTITASYSGYGLPTGRAALLSQSESGTYTYTGGGNTQLFQSYYDPTNTLDTTTPWTPGLQTLTVPSAGSGALSSSQNNPNSVDVPNGVYVTPYALTETITLNITGNTNTKGSNATAAPFGGQATISVVPEPGSLVMMLTGMPLPLVVLGILRSRLRTRAKRFGW